MNIAAVSEVHQVHTVKEILTRKGSSYFNNNNSVNNNKEVHIAKLSAFHFQT